jgi:predicted transcriptional regulator
MDAEFEKTLEGLGWKSGDIPDFLGMPDDERQEFYFRGDLGKAICKLREKLGLSENDLATRLKVSKAMVAKIESGHSCVPIEQMLKAYSALGGRFAITELPPHAVNGTVKKKTKAHAK